MPKTVTAGAMMKCSFGVAPSALIVTPENKLLVGTPAATIMDNIPIKNIPPFGMCNCPSNPQVATAAANDFGVVPVAMYQVPNRDRDDGGWFHQA